MEASKPAVQPSRSYPVSRRLCGSHAVIGMPASSAARKTVVETWQIPPPTARPMMPFSMAPPSTNPLS
jgi:hypothetical protein